MYAIFLSKQHFEKLGHSDSVSNIFNLYVYKCIYFITLGSLQQEN